MLEGAEFVVIWTTLPFLWHYLLKAAGLDLRRLTIPGFVLIAFYVYQYVGLPVLYFELDEWRASYVHDQWRMIQVFFYTALTITLMIFGCIVGRRFFGPLVWKDSTHIRESGKLQTFCVLVLFGICFSVLLLYVKKIGFENIALMGVMGFGDDMEAEVARSAMGNAFEGNYHWYNLFMNRILLFCVYAIFAQYLLKPNSWNRMLFIMVFLVASFAMTMAIEKGPMANFLIALFLIHVLVRREGWLPIKESLYLGVVLMVVLVVFYMGFMGMEDPGRALMSITSRVFTGQIQPAYHYLQYFPDHHDFLLGSSFPNPGGILPFRNFPLTTEMMAWHNPGQIQMGIFGSMPTVYWGEMYANFGFLGVLLPPFFIGLGIYWVNTVTMRLSLDPIAIALVVWLTMHLKNLSGASLSSYFFDIYAVATLFFFFVIAFISGKGVVRLQKKNRCFWTESAVK